MSESRFKDINQYGEEGQKNIVLIYFFTTTGCTTVQFAPSFYNVLPKLSKSPAEAKTTEKTPQSEPAQSTAAAYPNSSASFVTTPKHTAQKKRRRKSRWSSGFIAKRRSSCSPHTSRDDAHLESEEEDGDDDEEEEEVEKRGAAECEKMTEGDENPMMVDGESGPAPAQEGSLEPTENEQDSQQGREEKSPAAEDKVILCGSGKPEDDDQIEKESVDKDQSGQSEEIKVLKGENQTSESIIVDTNKDSHTVTEGDTQGPSNTEEGAETKGQELTETRTEKCRAVTQTDDSNKVVTVVEAEQNSPAEPMEEAANTSTTDVSAAHRGEEDTDKERSVRPVTPALKNAVLQQQQKVDVNKALQILEQETPPLVVDRDGLKELLERVVTKTESYEVYKLEKLYALLCQSIYRHRRDYNKTLLIQELEREIAGFC
ncbi:ATPase family AAA domain-containing protein 2-like [Notothenia coriiceps]|uniref:ATPase family AAA domain-containing protein 2-like n=1 Tax=Notothenia coriiceps TaxID=8208 RepID=A0A6I9NSV6_9TELE|nr:PREDICTED: ATPase family AAA domain-containing protein 2-like [Notothenia coriiceps]